jgi:hypothetical protein
VVSTLPAEITGREVESFQGLYVSGGSFENFQVEYRVARWFVFKPKNPNLGKFWRALDLKMFIYFNFMGYFMTIWYILCSLGTFFPVLVSCAKKNLATLVE